jgi:predicted transcriptional regulator
MNKQHQTETREERAARYERGDVEVSPNARIYEGDEAAARGRALMEAALDPEELAELERLTRGGRPSVGSSAARGESPKRQVRLPVELDAELTRRAKAEQRRPSEIMRDALTQYLSAS